jgi:FkbM family methyltransferase
MSLMPSIRKLAKAALPLRLHPIMFSLRRQSARSRKRQAELGPYATAVLTETEHGKLLVAASDLEVGRSLAQHGEYGLDEVRYHLGYLNSSSRVLVVGTHVGALLVPLAMVVGEVVGIEANPETFRFVQMNVLLNGLTNVKLFHLAAGDHDGEVDFLMHRCNTGASAVVAGDIARGDPREFVDSPKIVKVPMRRLDDALTGHSFDLVIMDIEGAEYAALQGMPKIMAASSQLQIEVIPQLAESRARITATQFADILSQHFVSARVLGSPESEATLEPIRKVIKRIFAQHGRGCDILLEKSTQAKHDGDCRNLHQEPKR